jgi:hypothetical protein
MNQRLRTLMIEAGYAAPELALRAHRLAELIIEDCAKLAEYQGYNQAFGQGGLRTKLAEYFKDTE